MLMPFLLLSFVVERLLCFLGLVWFDQLFSWATFLLTFGNGTEQYTKQKHNIYISCQLPQQPFKGNEGLYCIEKETENSKIVSRSVCEGLLRLQAELVVSHLKMLWSYKSDPSLLIFKNHQIPEAEKKNIPNHKFKILLYVHVKSNAKPEQPLKTRVGSDLYVPDRYL